MRVSDFIPRFLNEKGIDTVFLVVGGGSLYLNDGLASQNQIKSIFCHHEQAAGMAAVGYAALKGIGCAYVTTGCGGTNAVTAVLHAWQDSTPCIFISGQVHTELTVKSTGLPLRQFGPQEVDMMPIISSLTKYSASVTNPDDIKFHLEKAYYMAVSGRPGPVWLDVPVNVSSAAIEPESLLSFRETEPVLSASGEDYNYVVSRLQQAERPVVIAGQGIRLADACGQFYEFIKKHQIPAVASYMGVSVIPTLDPLYSGVVGIRGSRSGNYAVQNADLVLVLGSRMSLGTIGRSFELVPKQAHVIVVDIDPVEHEKKTINIDRLIVSDVKNFLNGFPSISYQAPAEWVARCKGWKEKYPICLPGYENDDMGINIYYFTKKLSEHLEDCDCVITDSGSTTFAVTQGILTKSISQRYIVCGAQGEMGFVVPAAVGVCAARGFERVIGITGDGSFQMNLQELQTIAHNKLPVKIFVWNNNGYYSIRANQEVSCQSRFFGVDEKTGVSFPSLEKVAYCYDISFVRIEKSNQLDGLIHKALHKSGPVLCEVMCQENQEITPRAGMRTSPEGKPISTSMADMYPFLPVEEHEENMLGKRKEVYN